MQLVPTMKNSASSNMEIERNSTVELPRTRHMLKVGVKIYHMTLMLATNDLTAVAAR
jgi:hypothetical protein